MHLVARADERLCTGLASRLDVNLHLLFREVEDQATWHGMKVPLSTERFTRRVMIRSNEVRN